MLGPLWCAWSGPRPYAAAHEGLHGIDRSIHLPGVCPDLLLHILLRTPGRLINSPLDRRLPNHDQGSLALLERLAYLLEVRAGHPTLEVADERSCSSSHKSAYQHGGREDQSDRSSDRQASPTAVLGGLLYLVYYLYLAFFVLGEYCSVVGSHDVLAVEVLEELKICFGLLDALVFARVEEHRAVAHLRFLLSASST